MRCHRCRKSNPAESSASRSVADSRPSSSSSPTSTASKTNTVATDHLRLFDHGALGVDLFFVISGVVIASVTAGKFASPATPASSSITASPASSPSSGSTPPSPSSPPTSFRPAGSMPTQAHPRQHPRLLSPHPNPPAHASPPRLDPQLRALLLPRLLLLLLFTSERIAPWLLALWGAAVIAAQTPHRPLPSTHSPAPHQPLRPRVPRRLRPLPHLPPLPPAPLAGILLLAASLLWLAAIIAYTAHIHSDAYWIIDHPWRRPILYGTFSALFLLGAIELERTSLIRYLPILYSIGDWSYSIYLAHVLVLALIAPPPPAPTPPSSSSTSSDFPPSSSSAISATSTSNAPSSIAFTNPRRQPQTPAKQPA